MATLSYEDAKVDMVPQADFYGKKPVLERDVIFRLGGGFTITLDPEEALDLHESLSGWCTGKCDCYKRGREEAKKDAT